MTPLPVSVCMISGAEEERIGRALASVAGWTAEVNVLINDEVNDRTETICREHGARVSREPWKGYVAQVNSVIAQATQPWLFLLDADEEISPALRGELVALFQDAARLERPAAFSMPRCTFYCGRWIRHGDWYPDRKARLWRRGRGRFEGQEPHYHLVVEGETGRLSSDLRHYSFRDLGHHLSKVGLYSSLFARDAMAAGRRASLWDFAVRPPWRFIRSYLIRAGFLDGRAGFCVAFMSATLTFLKYARLWESGLKQPPKT